MIDQQQHTACILVQTGTGTCWWQSRTCVKAHARKAPAAGLVQYKTSCFGLCHGDLAVARPSTQKLATSRLDTCNGCNGGIGGVLHGVVAVWRVCTSIIRFVTNN